jgi:hypothetical protein
MARIVVEPEPGEHQSTAVYPIENQLVHILSMPHRAQKPSCRHVLASR